MSSTDSSSGDQAPMLIAVEFCLLGLAILSTAVRVYTRLRITRTFDTDDILIVCALLATMALGAYVVIGQFLKSYLINLLEYYALAVP